MGVRSSAAFARPAARAMERPGCRAAKQRDELAPAGAVGTRVTSCLPLRSVRLQISLNEPRFAENIRLSSYVS
jgi:hypothetical protein